MGNFCVSKEGVSVRIPDKNREFYHHKSIRTILIIYVEGGKWNQI